MDNVLGCVCYHCTKSEEQTGEPTIGLVVLDTFLFPKDGFDHLTTSQQAFLRSCLRGFSPHKGVQVLTDLAAPLGVGQGSQEWCEGTMTVAIQPVGAHELLDSFDDLQQFAPARSCTCTLRIMKISRSGAANVA